MSFLLWLSEKTKKKGKKERKKKSFQKVWRKYSAVFIKITCQSVRFIYINAPFFAGEEKLVNKENGRKEKD